MYGVVAPLTTISPSTYQENELPWFDLYSEAPATNQAGDFQNVQSIAEVDEMFTNITKHVSEHSSHGLLDPQKPPRCSKCPRKVATCVYRPCNHFACADCLFDTQEHSEVCRRCNSQVERFVGFKNPVVDARKAKELEKELDDIEKEKSITGVSVDQLGDEKAWTILLDEDKVNRLHSRRGE
ncbi:hypothetical protein P7C70_g5446, partial [Phenoliferia sp. Uapishka_3]